MENLPTQVSHGSDASIESTGKDAMQYQEDTQIGTVADAAAEHRKGGPSAARDKRDENTDGDGIGSQENHVHQHAHHGSEDFDDLKWWNVGKRMKRDRSSRRHSHHHHHYKTYKRRWFGLLQLVLLNAVASWDWLTFAPVSTTAAGYFGVSESDINWLSTTFLFSFVVISPAVIYTLHRSPKEAIIWASVFLLLGNWIRYIGTAVNGGMFGVVMFGQILTGFGQPFVLAAPTRYSDLWFSESGRIRATALASLANPLGGAIGQLVNPSFGTVPNMVLYISIIATVACLPSFFIPRAPPTPPSASASLPHTPTLASIRAMLRSPPFYVVALTFSVYVGFFNAFSTLLNQILYPYGYTEDQAGICGAILIVVGLVAGAITSPIFDRTHAYLPGIKILSVSIAAAYLGMIWAPQTRGLATPYALSALEGAASFSILPIALEYLVEVTYPASPEIGSTIIWSGGQLLGGVFIIIMDALKDKRPVDLEKVKALGLQGNAGQSDTPPGNMRDALIFQAAVAMAVLPFPLALGIKRLGLAHGEGRLDVDERSDSEGENEQRGESRV